MKIMIKAYNHILYPDAVVVCEKIEYYAERKEVIINPLLIVEVLSDSTGTERVDRGAKFNEYESIPSFKEYILINQRRPLVSTYLREETDLWRIKEWEGMDVEIQLRSLGISLSMKSIFNKIESN